MPEAVEGVVAEEVVLDNALAAEAAEAAEFESGFTGVPTGNTPPADADALEKVVEPKVAAPAAAVVPKYRQITEAEWNELQARSTEIEQIKADQRAGLDKAFGKVGGVERTLAALQAATPVGYAVEVTDDMVADLKKEFPELGDLVLKALKGFAGKLKGTAPAVAAAIDPEQINTTVTSRLVALQTEALDEDIPKWRETVGAKDSSTPYRQWLAKQPADYQARLGSTNSAAVISKSILKFEADAKVVADTAAGAAKKAAAALAAQNATSARRQRLEQAATPRGAGGHAPTDTTDPFEEGFKSG